jgi:hypothetical protein
MIGNQRSVSLVNTFRHTSSLIIVCRIGGMRCVARMAKRNGDEERSLERNQLSVDEASSAVSDHQRISPIFEIDPMEVDLDPIRAFIPLLCASTRSLTL